MSKYGCRDCQSYEKRGHNYCKMCGFEFRPNTAEKARIAVANYVNERFCGYCGAPLKECDC